LIRNFSDHAANERTYLAWVRTAIAIMAFGFLVEKFDLFLRAMRLSVAAHIRQPFSGRLGEAAGIAVMALGLAIVVLATVRFVRTASAIDDAAQKPGPGDRLDLALAGSILLLGCALLAYLVYGIAGAG
jgi:putative membrane protein